MRTRLMPAVLAVFAFGTSANPANAGVFSDDLARCLVASSSEVDRQVLVRWIFVATAQHSKIEHLAKIPAKEQTKALRGAGELFERLILNDCLDKAKAAFRAEGAASFEAAFNALGQVASRDLFGDPAVAAFSGRLGEFADFEKIDEVLGAE